MSGWPGTIVGKPAGVALFLLLCVATPSCRKQETASSDPEPHVLENLGWLAGVWKGSGFEGSVEEHWTDPEGGSMVGLFRLVVAGKTRVVRMMTLAEEEAGIILRWSHFTPRLQRWEREEGPLRFLLTEQGVERAVFDCLSPQESLPQQLLYRQPQKDELSIEFRSNGKTSAVLQLIRVEN